MKERRRNSERHHLLPTIVGKIFRLPKSVCKDPSNIEYVTSEVHKRETKYLNDQLPYLYSLPKKGVIYKATIIPKERIKKKLDRSFEERQYDL